MSHLLTKTATGTKIIVGIVGKAATKLTITERSTATNTTIGTTIATMTKAGMTRTTTITIETIKMIKTNAIASKLGMAVTKPGARKRRVFMYSQTISFAENFNL